MKKIYKLFLTLNSTLLIVVVFLIKEKYNVMGLFFNHHITEYISYIIYLLIPFLLTGLSIFFARFLSNDSNESKVTHIEQANNAFLPSYLGYFFVALSISDINTLFFMYLILFIFTYFSQTLYFNPLFLLWNFKFYNITKDNNVTIFVICKDDLRDPNKVNLLNLRRINYYTYIKIGENDA